MRIPREFSHKGKLWKVLHEPNLMQDGYECNGLCDLDKRIIYLDSKLRGRKKKLTFLHELFHVMVHEAHVNPGSRFSGGVEEVLCDAFADLVTTSFADLKWKKNK